MPPSLRIAFTTFLLIIITDDNSNLLENVLFLTLKNHQKQVCEIKTCILTQVF